MQAMLFGVFSFTSCWTPTEANESEETDTGGGKLPHLEEKEERCRVGHQIAPSMLLAMKPILQ